MIASSSETEGKSTVLKGEVEFNLIEEKKKKTETLLPIFKVLAAASRSACLTTFPCSNKDSVQSRFLGGLLKHFLKKMSLCTITASKMDSFHYQALVIKGFVLIANLS